MKRALMFVLASAAWVLACGAEGSRGEACNAGETAPCACPNGEASSQLCGEAAVFGECACSSADGGVFPDAAPPARACGNSLCERDPVPVTQDGAVVMTPGESCRTCPRDCGECPACPLAPSCTDAVGVPSKPTLRSDLSDPPVANDGGVAAAGPVEACLDPELRLRIERVVVHSGGGQIYCIVSADDGATSEAALTGKTKNLGDEETNFFDTTTAVYWGQKDLHPTTNNLAVTFNCFLVKTDSWSKVVKAIGDTATTLGGTPTPFGWAFGLGGVAANAAAAGIAAANTGDELRLNAQQVIDKKQLLDLTNGRYWSIRKSRTDCTLGVFCGGWDWEIFVQSWGCAQGVEAPK